MGEKVGKSRNLVNFDPRKFFGGVPNLKLILGTPFQKFLPRKVWTTPPDPKGVGKNFAPKIFLGRASHGGT